MDSFRTVLWANDGYIVIIIPMAITEIYYQVMMIRNNPEFYEKVRHDNRKYSLAPFIWTRVFTDVILALVGISLIIGDQFPGSIIDINKYTFWDYFSYVAIFGLIPLLGYISSYLLKKSFGVKSEIDHNRFRIDLTRISFWICMTFIFTLIGVIFFNIITKQLVLN